MSTTQPTIEAKIARAIYHNLTPLVVKASTHPILCKLNLHNNDYLKKINRKTKMVYTMGYQPDVIVKASYDRGGEDNIENALLSIAELVRGDHHEDHKEYIFKRINYLATEALTALHDRNHQDWLVKIGRAIQDAKTLVKEAKVKKKPVKQVVKSAKSVKSKKTKTVKKLALARRRNKKGQFIASRRKR